MQDLLKELNEMLTTNTELMSGLDEFGLTNLKEILEECNEKIISKDVEERYFALIAYKERKQREKLREEIREEIRKEYEEKKFLIKLKKLIKKILW